MRIIFRKFVVFMAKPIPARDPFWPFVLGSIGIGFSWTYLPYIFWHPFNTIPWFKTFLAGFPFADYLPFVLAYMAPTLVSLACLMLLCRGLQILDPEEFDLYNDE